MSSTPFGDAILARADELARHSDVPLADVPAGAARPLTVTYLTEAHRACAADLVQWMREDGFDEAHVDAVGNVVGVCRGTDASAPRLLTGSHYDTVRNAGRYDGRLGIFVPMACVRALRRQGRRLPFDLEVVGFAEEEGQRFAATFIGSGALAGAFDPAWLDLRDADGVTMREAMGVAGHDPADIAALKRDASAYRGFVEVHIEQGPVLSTAGLALGRGHGHQRQRALRRRDDRCRLPRWDDADGPTARRGDRRRRACAVRGTARVAGAVAGRHGRPDARARRVDQRCARPLPVQPGPARPERRTARRAGRRRAHRARGDRGAARLGLYASPKRCAPAPRPAIPRCSDAGNARSPPPERRSSTCPAVPATTP